MDASRATAPQTNFFNREFLTLAATASCFFFVMGALNPLFPRYLGDELGATNFVVGAISGTFAIGSLFTRIGFGRIGTTQGTRMLLFLGQIIGVVATLLMFVAFTPGLAAISRVVQGAALAAMMTGATTMAVDLAPRDRKGEAASYIFVAFHLGLGFGPVGGEAILNLGGWTWVWIVLVVIHLAGLAIAFGLPPRGNPAGHEQRKEALFQPSAIGPGVVAGLGMMPFVALSIFLPLYGPTIGLPNVGTAFLAASAAIAAVRLFAGKAPDRFGAVPTGVVAIVLLAGGSAVIGAWGSVPGLYVGASVLAAGLALQTPAMMKSVVEQVTERQRSSAMATFTLFLDLGVALSAPFFGFVVGDDRFGLMFYVGSLLALAGLLVLWIVVRPALAGARSEPPTNSMESEPAASR